jgi:HupE / UreJ protein
LRWLASRSLLAWPNPLRFCALTVLFLFVPDAALAHGSVPGFKGFYLGLAHPLTVPGVVLALASLGMLLGQNGLKNLREAWFAFVVGMALGLAIIFSARPRLDVDALLFVMSILISLVVASAWTLPATAATAIGFITGGLASVAITPDPGPLGATIISVAGAVSGANLIVLVPASWIDYLREMFDRPWLGIAVRVVASWIAAISALMLALSWTAEPGGRLVK